MFNRLLISTKWWLAAGTLLVWLGYETLGLGQEDGLLATRSIDFTRDIVPILTQAGCNSGACHGAAAGRGYLSLSLFGARPSEDYRRLLFEQPGRYIDLEQPTASRLLQKPAGELDHGGGLRLDETSQGYQLVRQWIQQGAHGGTGDKLLRLEVYPNRRIVADIEETVYLQLKACWSSGAESDAGPWISLSDSDSLDSHQAPVHAVVREGRLELTPRRAGYWPLILRFADQSVTLQVYTPQVNMPQTAASQSEPTGVIDQRLAEMYKQLNLSAAGACRSSTLVRRWWIDLLGRPPTLSEWEGAIAAVEQGEAERVVDELLGHPQFQRRLTSEVLSWCEGNGRRASDALRGAVNEYFTTSDRLVPLVERMLLLPNASAETEDTVTHAIEPLNEFHLLAVDPRERVELIARSWLGVRLECARCHDHPLDRWTQADYFGMAACWAEIDVGEGRVRRLVGGTTTDLRTGRDAVPRVPGQLTDDQPADGLRPPQVDGMEQSFVQWLVRRDHKLLYRHAVNRVCKWLLGTGLFNPVDDQRETNPSMHEALLGELVEEFERTGGSLEPLVRSIVLSGAYRRASLPEAKPLQVAALAMRSPKQIAMPPEALAGWALSLAVHTFESNREGAEQRMEAVTQGCPRGTACTDPVSASIDLVAGQSLNRFISETISVQSEDYSSPMGMMRELHRRLFHDLPTAEEERLWPRELIEAELDDGGLGSDTDERARILAAAEDLLWSWLVSNRFRTLD